MAKRHTVFELQDRLMIGSMLQEKKGDFDLLQKPTDKLYEILVGTTAKKDWVNNIQYEYGVLAEPVARALQI